MGSVLGKYGKWFCIFVFASPWQCVWVLYLTDDGWVLRLAGVEGVFRLAGDGWVLRLAGVEGVLRLAGDEGVLRLAGDEGVLRLVNDECK